MENRMSLNSITPTDYSRYVYIERTLDRLLKEKVRNACDIGCGTGKLLSILDAHGIKSKGIDISEESLAIARTRIGFTNIEIEKKDAFNLNEQFDLVCLLEVLEHVDDDKRLLEFLRRKVVKRNG